MWATDRQIEDTCDVFSQSSRVSHGCTGNPEVTDYTLSAGPDGIWKILFCTLELNGMDFNMVKVLNRVLHIYRKIKSKIKLIIQPNNYTAKIFTIQPQNL